MGQADPPVLSDKSTKLKLSTVFSDQSEYSDLAEKIFDSVNLIFQKDKLLDEFDLVPVESKSNHSPVIHDESEHKLALESWCVPYLYTHAYKSFMAVQIRQRRSSSSALSSDAYGSSKICSLSEVERISRGCLLSRLLVLLNPDLALAWNFRRRHVHLTAESIQDELRLINLVASRKPKCPEGFSYRRWLIRSGASLLTNSQDSVLQWILVELKAIESPINRYFSNYHAWDYRLWLVDFITKKNFLSEEDTTHLLKDEWTFSNDWISAHVSDYCGCHYRQGLIGLLASHQVWKEEVRFKIEQELEDNCNRIQTYEGHESLWYHRRAILTKLRQLTPDSNSSLKANEESFVRLVKSKESTKDFSKLNLRLCSKHVLWLRRSLNCVVVE